MEKDTRLPIVSDISLSEVQPVSATTITVVPAKLKGKIIHLNGQVAGNEQIILFGTSGKAAALPLGVAKTDKDGNWIMDYPKEQFTEAFAVISSDAAAKYRIALDQAGKFPPSVLIVAENSAITGSKDNEDCACHSESQVPRLPDAEELVGNTNYSQDIGGSCTNFTTPNRALEEFSYFRIIRTTDPGIITPEDTQKINALDEIIRKLRQDIFALERDAYPVAYVTDNKTKKATVKPADASAAQTALEAARQSLAQKTAEKQAVINNLQTRKELSVSNMLDWDNTPTTYQNTTIAHGHIIEFRQVWRADGYSMGDLLYSLPLAPGQKRQIAVYDWDRTDQATRLEDQTQQESLANELSRDRDISEIVSSVLNENQEAESQVKGKTTSWGVGVSVSTPTPVSVGVSGSFSMSNTNMNSSASQSSSRDLAASSLQQIKDKTMQKASSVRSARSTVIQTVNQGESVSARTEVVANYNHCHAITIQYFEVLRHFALYNEIADVKECLFIPLPVTPFDDGKVIRWKDILKRALAERRLLPGFDSVERYYRFNVENNSDAYAGFPNTRICDERLSSVSVRLKMNLYLSRPAEIYPDTTMSFQDFVQSIGASYSIFNGFENLKNQYEEERTKAILNHQDDINVWQTKLGFIPGWADIRRKVLTSSAPARDAVFQQEIAKADWVAHYIQQLVVSCFFPAQNGLKYPISPIAKFKIYSRSRILNKSVKADGYASGEEIIIGINSFNVSGTVLTRAHFSMVEICANSLVQPASLPAGSFVKVLDGSMEYVSPNFRGSVFESIHDSSNLAAGEIIVINTPVKEAELRNPRTEDIKKRTDLLNHFNANLEAYHHWLFYMMSPDRRYMMLDGLLVNVPGRKIPGTNTYYPDEKRSVASVVENRVIGVVGNNMIMPVAPGYNLDPKFRFDDDAVVTEDGTKISALMHHYMPERGFRSAPFRISVPTKGVFAEAIMGACNSCEKIDNSRYWKWEEHPIPDDPTAISPLNTDSRYQNAGNLSAKDFAEALVALKDAPALPDPTGMQTALNNIVKGDSFRDITGLQGLQDLAKQGIISTSDAAKQYAANATDLAKQQANLRNSDSIVNSIKNSGLPKEEQEKLIKSHLEKQIGVQDTSKQPSSAGKSKPGALDKLIDKAVSSNKGKVNMTTAEGDSIDMNFEDAEVQEPGTETEQDFQSDFNPVIDETENIDLNDPDFIQKRARVDQLLTGLTPALQQYLDQFNMNDGSNNSTGV